MRNSNTVHNDLSEAIANAVVEYLTIRAGKAQPRLTRDSKGIWRASTRCGCCEMVSGATMARSEVDRVHASTLTHICYSRGLEGYLTQARQIANRAVRRYSGMEAVEAVRDPALRADLFKPQ